MKRLPIFPILLFISLVCMWLIGRAYKSAKERQARHFNTSVSASNTEVYNNVLVFPENPMPTVVIIITNGVGNHIALELSMAAWTSTNPLVINNRMKLWK